MIASRDPTTSPVPIEALPEYARVHDAGLRLLAPDGRTLPEIATFRFKAE